MEELKPCPFCGRKAVFDDPSEVYGTCFEYDCDCGLSRVSLQICDYMTIDERIEDDFENHKYNIKYVERVIKEAIKLWNTRVTDTKERT